MGSSFLTDRDLERSCTSYMLDQVLKTLRAGSVGVGKSYLDVGCGFGGIAAAIGSTFDYRHVSGIEIDPVAVNESKLKGVEAVEWDIANLPLPFEDESFDLITTFGVLDYLPWFDDILRELHRLTRMGGHVLVTLPNLAGWHNRLLLAFGYQPRDIEVSRETVVGVHSYYRRAAPHPVGHIHTTTSRAFKELMEYVGFRTIRLDGAGPTNLTEAGRAMRVLDSIASRFPRVARRFIYLGQKVLAKPIQPPPAAGWWQGVLTRAAASNNDTSA